MLPQGEAVVGDEGGVEGGGGSRARVGGNGKAQNRKPILGEVRGRSFLKFREQDCSG